MIYITLVGGKIVKTNIIDLEICWASLQCITLWSAASFTLSEPLA